LSIRKANTEIERPFTKVPGVPSMATSIPWVAISSLVNS